MESFMKRFPPICEEGLLKRLGKPSGKVDVVLDTDAFNECDDQYAIAYWLQSGVQLNVKAIYAAPFDKPTIAGPGEGMELSHREILNILDLMDIREMEQIVFRGSERFLPSETEPVFSDAAMDLAQRAMGYTEEQPLYVIALGAATDVASALLIEPKIRDRIVVIWLGGCAHHWPDNREFNLYQDIAAGRILFGCGVALVQVPGPGVVSAFTTSGPELDHWLGNKNKLCDYLLQHTKDHVRKVGGKVVRTTTIDKTWSRPIWDVVPIAWLMDDEFVEDYLEHSPVPEYNDTYSFDKRRHMIRYVYNVHRDKLFTDLFEKIGR